MIRYSFDGDTYYWTKPGTARWDLVRRLEAEYLELLELRERVRQAEEAAQRGEPRRWDPQKTATNCAEPNSAPHCDRRHLPRRPLRR
jgi:hypothetical protein